VRDITTLLERLRDGDASARDALFPAVYDDLEAIANAHVLRGGGSLEPRGLVHELYLKLTSSALDARDRKHFYAIAAVAMRRILVDRARKRRSAKRGGRAVRVTLSGLPGDTGDCDLVAVEQALRRLEELSERQARIVELRCLVGLTAGETAEALGISERTVQSDWRLARAWLTRALESGS
jgi:RNA polymerase sigma-70 factor, ECF subfamily